MPKSGKYSPMQFCDRVDPFHGLRSPRPSLGVSSFPADGPGTRRRRLVRRVGSLCDGAEISGRGNSLSSEPSDPALVSGRARAQPAKCSSNPMKGGSRRIAIGSLCDGAEISGRGNSLSSEPSDPALVSGRARAQPAKCSSNPMKGGSRRIARGFCPARNGRAFLSSDASAKSYVVTCTPASQGGCL